MESRVDVAVDTQGDRNRGVTETFLHDPGMDAPCRELLGPSALGIPHVVITKGDPTDDGYDASAAPRAMRIPCSGFDRPRLSIARCSANLGEATTQLAGSQSPSSKRVDPSLGFTCRADRL